MNVATVRPWKNFPILDDSVFYMWRGVFVVLIVIACVVTGGVWWQRGAVPPTLEQLATLEVKGKAPTKDSSGGMYAYSREAFGQKWSDDVTVEGGHNGCDTRNDVLRTQLEDVVVKPGTRGCVVLSGTLHDPYSGDVIAFQRGADTSSLVQIDHVVALANAWQTGAFAWSDEKRRNFANDPRNLLAVKGSLNEQKKAADAAAWLPPAGRCEYAARQVAVKAAYGLWVTEAEKEALRRVLAGCG